MAIWHPVKWWYQRISKNVFGGGGGDEPGEDDTVVVGFGPKGDPPGQLDSGWYWRVWNEALQRWEQIAPMWYKCLSCCCTPQKCNIPDEILMTLSGFSGTLSSIDYPSDYGHGPTKSCPCNIVYLHNCTQDTTNPLHPYAVNQWRSCWFGFDTPCCNCMKQESYYWWPRDIVGTLATGDDMCSLERPICDLFPHLCASTSQSRKIEGRIPARFMETCSACGYPQHGDLDDYGNPIDLIRPTDCAKAPLADAMADYNCLNQVQSPFIDSGFLPLGHEKSIAWVADADSYLPPPGFRGVEAKNLLPLCDNRFWNDSTYYRFCVEGGFWCTFWGDYDQSDDFFDGFPNPRRERWQESDWCKDSPNRCQGPVKVADVNWNYYRPNYVLISQPSQANCASCFSGISNPLLRDDPNNPYSGSQDGHCSGKTDVNMADFNRTMIMRSRLYNAPPRFDASVTRARETPESEPRQIDARLLYETSNYNGSEYSWHIDYPCEPRDEEGRCTINSGLVQPKLRAFYQGNTGSGAKISFRIRSYCPPPVAQLKNYGSMLNGGFWYVSAVWIEEGSDDCECSKENETQGNRGAGYEVGDKFIFDYYEDPLRGGETYWPTFFGVQYQQAEVLSVGAVGEILQIMLVRHNRIPNYTSPYLVNDFDLVLNVGCDPLDPPLVKQRRPPLYARALPHRYAVITPGNGYVEGDIIFWEPRQSFPTGKVFTGNKFRPYFDTSLSTRQKAKATVTDVDSRGGIIDWHLCGAENILGYTQLDFECYEYNAGNYVDIRYAPACVYEYQGFLPVRYAWSGIMDVRFRAKTYCEHAWAEFFFRVEQVSVKNTIEVHPPPQEWGRQAKLAIKTVNTDMQINSVTINPLFYQNYEVSPGPSDYTDLVVVESVGTWYKKHPLPVKQGGIAEIEIIEPGAGYVYTLPKENPEDPDEAPRYEPMPLSTDYNTIRIRSVVDDLRAELKNQGIDGFAQVRAEIDMNEDSENFGGILSIEIIKPGLWYFEHEHDHVWLGQAGSNWYFELASPVPDNSDDFSAPDCSIDISSDNPCCAASRDNWGELQHFDGFCEPYPSGYHELQVLRDGGIYTYWRCDTKNSETAAAYRWPKSLRHLPGGDPGITPAGDYKNRWSVNFCPTDLLQRSYRMLLIHPCAACAKELGIPGAQTCWNMNGLPDTTYTPPGWRGTGTAMISGLGSGSLRCRTSLISSAS